ncbi:MAG TPA: FAD-dependent oxidoreductase [Chloroflexota bacterium]|jgi:NADPH-dependent glutamate synthase beta subunit-like oxidoreductase
MRALPTEVAVTIFDEVPLGYSREEATQEARRAHGADFAASQAACPFGVPVGVMVAAIAAGDFDAARGVVLQAHPWPGILGRHCHAPCVRAHTLGPGVEPLFIGALERAAADHGDRARFPFQPGAPTGYRVAVLGAGSAASAAAYRLRQFGHAVTIYEQLPVSGGMMFTGYPNFRLPLAVLRAENAPEAWGVEMRYNVRVDTALVERLVAEYDAVLLGTGKFKEVRLDVPGEDLDGVWSALDFLTQFKLGNHPPVGRRVVVVGAGYTAQDSSRTCVRLGCQVQVLYRRTQDDMPVLPFLREKFVTRQAAEGAPYVFQTTPVRILGEQGRVVGVECVRTAPGPLDASGRPTAVPVEGSNYVIECDTVIEATGEEVDLSFLPGTVRLKDAQHVWVDEQWMTSLPKLYAAGEMTGISGTERAFASGFQAAAGIDCRVRSGEGAPAAAKRR